MRKDLDTLPSRLDLEVGRGDSRGKALDVKPKQPSGVKVLIVEKPTDASAVSFGFPIGLLRNDPDFVPLLVANWYLGERRNSVGHPTRRSAEHAG